MFEELRSVLETSGGLPMEQGELLDVLWLAPRVPSGPAAPLAAHAPDTTLPSSLDLDATVPNSPAVPGSGAGTGRGKSVGGTPRPASRTAPHLAVVSGPSAVELPGGALWTPGVRSLGPTLVLDRALRPLKRRVPSRRLSELDEAATATLQADTRTPQLVLRARPERWLRLVLVIDGGVSMPLWQRQCADLKGLFERSGAFRQVETHQIHYGTEVRLGRPWSTAQATRPADSVADVSGRTMVLVVTDGTAIAWRDERLRPVLEGWARCGPTAVLHTLPRRLWAGSGVRADTWQVMSPRPGAANTTWTVTDQVLPPTVAPPPPVPVPVLELTPAGLATWTAVNTIVARPIPVSLWAPDRTRTPTALATIPVSVRDFARAASSEALRLAAHLAAMAPITVPVMQLVHACLDQHQGPVPLAEVFLSGLVQPLPSADHSTGRHRLFDFTPEAKDLLLDAVPTAELLACGRRVGERMEALIGHSSDFPAWLRDENAPGSRAPFAYLGSALQARLGVAAAAADVVVLSPADEGTTAARTPPVEEFTWVSTEGLDASLRLLSEAVGTQSPEVLPRWDHVMYLVDSVAESRGEPPADVRPRLRKQYLDALLPTCPVEVRNTFSRVRGVPQYADLLLLHLVMYIHSRPNAARMSEAQIAEDLTRYLDERGLYLDVELRPGHTRADLLWRIDDRYCPVEIKRTGSPFSWPLKTQVAQFITADDSATAGFLVIVDDDKKPDGAAPLDKCVVVWPDLPVVGLRLQTGTATSLQALPGSRRACIVVDIVGYAKMGRTAQRRKREVLRNILDHAVRMAGVSRHAWARQDRGGGTLVLLPRGADAPRAIPGFVDGLAQALRHAREQGNAMRVRVAMDIGVVTMEEHGAAGDAVISSARLAESAVLRGAKVDYTLIVSDLLYEDVPGFHGRFRRVRVDHKGFESWAWLQARSSRLPDPERSNAVLVGTGLYTELTDLPQVHAGLRDLALLLSHPSNGAFYDDRVMVLENPKSASEIVNVVQHAAASADDTLLVYYAGHSLYDSVSGELSLALASTRPNAPVTAVPFDHIRALVQQSAARHKIVILDCCYSGHAGRHALPGVFNVVPDGDVTILAASLQFAVAPPGNRYTAFTGGLIDVLRDGVAEGSEAISVRELYEELRRRFRGDFPPPTLTAHNDTGQVALALNPVRQPRHS